MINGKLSPEEEMTRYALIVETFKQHPERLTPQNREYLGKVYHEMYDNIRACDLREPLRTVRSRLLVFAGVESGIIHVNKGVTI